LTFLGKVDSLVLRDNIVGGEFKLKISICLLG
jgi:hypothetical protein